MALEDKLPAAVRNEVFYFVARFCMVLCTCVLLPIGGWLLTRVITKADEISDQLARQNVALQLLSNDVKYRFTSIEDHEHRIRFLERR